ncbi:hypothetical protein D0Y50_18945 [Salinimonas sediminis]|uniref:Peptidase M15A C-terminal domain-containing protein n=2 Tax=Salinimonas sediminis TaxID=2303538 RepID=A0A346NRU4_9ALTE|nr:hypothetical protein D0Y50_18945 [Salinimonas sediminis]
MSLAPCLQKVIKNEGASYVQAPFFLSTCKFMERYLTSNEIKSLLQLSNRELKHMRENGLLQFKKVKNRFLYFVPSTNSILNYSLGEQLINWHQKKHGSKISNSPHNVQTIRSLEKLVWDLLLPIERHFGKETVHVTYGFTSTELKRYISKYSSANTYPALDQHASYEKNAKDNSICSRGGAACDFYVLGMPSSDIVKFISKHLEYDRIYYYGADRPLHVSVNLNESTRHLQIMRVSEKGRRYPSKKAFGEAAIKLAKEL